MTRVASRVLIAAMCLLSLVCSALADDSVPSSVGRAPEFTVEGLDGKQVSLSSFKGKVVLLNFWATYCSACVQDMPRLNALQNKLSPRGLKVVALSTDSSMRKLKDFLDDNPMDFLVLQDDGLVVAHKYKVFSTPTTFLIDKRGEIIQVFYGGQDWTSPEISSIIERLL